LLESQKGALGKEAKWAEGVSRGVVGGETEGEESMAS
jgi:hypothetical protein